MNFSIPLILWFVGPMFGLASIVVSVWFSGTSLLSTASYRPTIPSIYFIAVTLSAAALADAYEFAANTDRTNLRGRIVLMATVGVLFNLLFLFANTALFIYAIKAYADSRALVTVWDVAPAFLALVLALIMGFLFKAAAESVKLIH